MFFIKISKLGLDRCPIKRVKTLVPGFRRECDRRAHRRHNVLCYLMLLLSLPTWATTPPPKTALCSACHGEQGISPNPAWPNLAGQHAVYLIQQLKHYQRGKARSSAIMTSIVTAINDQDIKELAQFYAAKSLAPPANTNNSIGEKLYRQGDIMRQIPACIACHGPDGKGNAQAGFPMISHQQKEYIIQQLQAFQTRTRQSDPLAIMRTISAKLTPNDMQHLAKYLATIP